MKSPLSRPKHFPKTPPTNTITFCIIFSTYEFGEDTNIQTLAILSGTITYFELLFRIWFIYPLYFGGNIKDSPSLGVFISGLSVSCSTAANKHQCLARTHGKGNLGHKEALLVPSWNVVTFLSYYANNFK